MRRIKNFPGYFVTEYGEIFRELKSGSLKKVNHNIRKKDGYCLVVLRKDKKPCARYLHRLVAERFCLKKNKNHVVNHKDANKKNNIASNLEWVSIQENNNHKHENGLCAFGTGIWASKINDDIALDIFKSELPSRELGRIYKISKTSVLNIKKKKTWRHIHG
ncbi:MAG: HNH endonuclease [Bdellovibrionales bacterium]|nr:HNH endonuclease [Bdellovibrionales bacterium]